MVGLPAATPVAIPVEEPIVANELLLLVHVPPGVVELNIVVRPVQTVSVPVIFAGFALTVTVFVAATVHELHVV